jgi:hypothetical protein
MIKLLGPLFLIGTAALLAQSADDPQVVAAKAELTNVQSLVAVGVAPRTRLAKAEEALADAEDAAVLRRTAYGDLTLAQADDMVAAANRRLDRRQKALDESQRLVAAGVAPANTVKPLAEEVEAQRQECSLVDTRAKLVQELSEMAAAEETYAARAAEQPDEAAKMAESFTGDGVLAYATYAKVEVAFQDHFGKSMPVSAVGETAVHRALGFDHRGRVDVAINPDQPEGVWLLYYLRANHIPYYAFRRAVPGKATGAHIHIGPGSTRLASGG